MNQETQSQSSLLSYIQSELNRIQTIAGTLSTIETAHFQNLMSRGDDHLSQIAAEEQSGARQLGEVKQICIALAEKLQAFEDNNDQNLQ